MLKKQNNVFFMKLMNRVEEYWPQFFTKDRKKNNVWQLKLNNNKKYYINNMRSLKSAFPHFKRQYKQEEDCSLQPLWLINNLILKYENGRNYSTCDSKKSKTNNSCQLNAKHYRFRSFSKCNHFYNSNNNSNSNQGDVELDSLGSVSSHDNPIVKAMSASFIEKIMNYYKRRRELKKSNWFDNNNRLRYSNYAMNNIINHFNHFKFPITMKSFLNNWVNQSFDPRLGYNKKKYTKDITAFTKIVRNGPDDVKHFKKLFFSNVRTNKVALTLHFVSICESKAIFCFEDLDNALKSGVINKPKLFTLSLVVACITMLDPAKDSYGKDKQMLTDILYKSTKGNKYQLNKDESKFLDSNIENAMSSVFPSISSRTCLGLSATQF